MAPIMPFSQGVKSPAYSTKPKEPPSFKFLLSPDSFSKISLVVVCFNPSFPIVLVISQKLTTGLINKNQKNQSHCEIIEQK